MSNEQSKELQISGIDTILGLVGELPKENKIPYKIQFNQQKLIQEWNTLYIAIILYCFKCKEPLVWHTHPQGDTLFHCPKCNVIWIKGEGWKKIDE